MSKTRKITIAVRQWASEEGIHTWKYCKQHVLQPKDGTQWHDQLTLLHVAGNGKPGKPDSRTGRSEKERDREREAWDSGGPTIPDVATAMQPYNCAIKQLEGDAALALADYVNKEGMDILVLASRGRGAVKKAMMGSITEQVMARAACACLVVKPQVGAGDTYRMKTAASASGAQALTPTAAAAAAGAPPPRSPVASPIFRRLPTATSGALTTPFNRRVAIAYDTTASGRYLLKWAAENILEPADNIFVVRAVPRMRRPGTSFADKNSVQRLAGDALSGLPHITTFNMPQQAGKRAVLDFVDKESVDLLVIGMYKGACKRKGLARRGNATTIYNRCACPVLVVPMSEAALVVAVKAAELEAAAAEEEELASGSESDSSEDLDEDGEGPSPPHWGSMSLNGPRALMGSIAGHFNFKRRNSGQNEPPHSPSGRVGGAAAAGALALASSGLSAGRYVLEIDAGGGIKSINPLSPGDGSGGEGSAGEGGAGAGAGAGVAPINLATLVEAAAAAPAAAATSVAATGPAGASAGELQLQLLRQKREISDLKAQLQKLLAGGGSGSGATAAGEAAKGAGGGDGSGSASS